MKLSLKQNIIHFLFLLLSTTASSQTITKITEEDIYNFMNSTVFNDDNKYKINPSVLLYKYDSVYCEDKDSNAVYGIDCLIKDFTYYADTLSNFIDSNDIEFFKKQVKENAFLKWDQDKFPENVKVLRKQRVWFSDFSFPLFSLDKKTVILATMEGPLRFTAYHWNETTKKWDFIDVVQHGT